MSGIFGRFDFEGRKDEGLIDELGRWNKPYGSNECVEWKNDFIFLGCYIERIKEENSLDSYSVVNEGKIGVFDALIYNLDELSVNMTESRCHKEDILFSYVKKNGINSLKKVNGDFAGAIYDEQLGQLILFRDHMGVRPLYYEMSDAFFAFSTDIRGICGMHDYIPEISEEWMYNMFMGYPNLGTENTELGNVKCVPPGGYLIVNLKEKSVKKGQYWNVGEKKIHRRNEREYIAEFRALIEDSIKKRLAVCNDPIGAELSGGLDSGVIDILINRNGRKGLFYSWSYSPDVLDYQKGDERLVIKDICEQEKIECYYIHAIDIEKARTVKWLKELDAWDEECFIFELQYVFPLFANTSHIMAGSELLGSKGAKVMFTGHGGDEGVSHRAIPAEMLCAHEYYHYLRYMFSQTHGKRYRVINTLRNCRNDISELRKQMKEPFVSIWSTPEMISKQLRMNSKERIGESLTFGYDNITYIRRGGSRSRLDNTALQGGFAGVRYMIPYLDYRVVDYAVSIPRYMYLRGRRNRYIFREAFKDIMPDSLYRLKGKSSTSFNGIDDTDSWYAPFSEDRQYVYEHLDRDMWQDYIDFDFIDAYMKEGKPSEENRRKCKAVYYNMLNCMMIQNMLEKSKKRRDT